MSPKYLLAKEILEEVKALMAIIHEPGMRPEVTCVENRDSLFGDRTQQRLVIKMRNGDEIQFWLDLKKEAKTAVGSVETFHKANHTDAAESFCNHCHTHLVKDLGDTCMECQVEAAGA
jgi:hypothetical protein